MSAAAGAGKSAHPMVAGRDRTVVSSSVGGLREEASGGGEGGDILQQWRLARRLAEARSVLCVCVRACVHVCLCVSVRVVTNLYESLANTSLTESYKFGVPGTVLMAN